MKTYRLIIGPYIWCEFSVHKGMSTEDECRLLGAYMVEGTALCHRVYGLSCEVRVQSYIRNSPEDR